MANSWPRIIRDSIHNLIPFHDTPWDRLLLDLIDTKEVQRLRRIKQLGFSELVFPGANHSRFAHSLGVLHITKKFLEQFDRVTGTTLDPHQSSLVLAASLLHDIGHGPFSHAFEKVTSKKHEAFTRDIIRDPATEVHQKLVAFDSRLPQLLAAFFDEDVEEGQLPQQLPGYLVQVISSQLDADRCDYLLRDSYATGTDYGNYDLEWLITHVRPQQDGKRFLLTRKALSAAEVYVFARFHMYRAVYFHKTTRAAEVMLKLIFRRFKELLGEGGTIESARALIPDAPGSILAAFTGQMSLLQYLELDDHTVTEFLKACVKAQDKVLAKLSEGLLHRKLYKAIDVTNASRADIGAFTAGIQPLLQKELGSDYVFMVDTSADIPYKPYDLDAEKPATQIYIENDQGKPQEISLISSTVQQLQKEFELVRYYFPETIRPGIEALAAVHLQKGKP